MGRNISICPSVRPPDRLPRPRTSIFISKTRAEEEILNCGVLFSREPARARHAICNSRKHMAERRRKAEPPASVNARRCQLSSVVSFQLGESGLRSFPPSWRALRNQLHKEFRVPFPLLRITSVWRPPVGQSQGGCVGPWEWEEAHMRHPRLPRVLPWQSLADGVTLQPGLVAPPSCTKRLSDTSSKRPCPVCDYCIGWGVAVSMVPFAFD